MSPRPAWRAAICPPSPTSVGGRLRPGGWRLSRRGARRRGSHPGLRPQHLRLRGGGEVRPQAPRGAGLPLPGRPPAADRPQRRQGPGLFRGGGARGLSLGAKGLTRRRARSRPARWAAGPFCALYDQPKPGVRGRKLADSRHVTPASRTRRVTSSAAPAAATMSSAPEAISPSGSRPSSRHSRRVSSKTGTSSRRTRVPRPARRASSRPP